jgi:hypothetical protein
MGRLSIFGALALVSACATAEPLGGTVEQQDAAPPQEFPDAAPPDAGPTEVTLSQSMSMDIETQNSIACVRTVNNVPQFTLPNSYFRVFDLAEEIAGDLEINAVTMGVQRSDPGGQGMQVVDIRLHTLEGSFVVANLTQLATAQLELGDETQSIHEIPIEATAPADSKLVVEVFAATGDPDRFFFLGSNSLGETGDSFIRSPDCDFNEPIAIRTLEVGDPPAPATSHMVLMVSGIGRAR